MSSDMEDQEVIDDRLSDFSDALPEGDWPDHFDDTNSGVDEPIGDEFTNGEVLIGGGQWAGGQFITDNEEIGPEFAAEEADALRARQLDEELNRRNYNLRPRGQEYDLMIDEWDDDDKTGDYDPEAEKVKRKKARAQNRVKARNAQRKTSNKDELEDEENAVLSSREDEDETKEAEEEGDDESDSESDEDSEPLKPQRKQKKRPSRPGTKISWNPSPDRPTIACDICRRAETLHKKNPKEYKSMRCSLYKDQEQKIPCSQCTKNGTNCTFSQGYEQASDPKPSVGGQVRKANDEKKEEKVKAAALKAKLQRGNERWISTYFSHPITFNYFPDPESDPDSSDCNFCKPTYGLYGLGLKRLKVLDPLDGTGLIEAWGGGHNETGIHPTKMCEDCTFSRMTIINCKDHLIKAVDRKLELERIAGNPKMARKVMDTLDERKEAGKEVKICSICPRIAVYECATVSEFDANGAEAGSINEDGSVVEGVIGCGLCLCEICAGTLTEKSGNLDNAIRRAKLSTSLQGDYPDGVRADVEFLLKDGLLMTQLMQQAEMEEKRRLAKEEADRKGGERERVRVGKRWI